MTKGTRFYSIIHHKCPRCHEGDMFQSGPLSKNFARMNARCPECGLDFMQEPSFYFGAMYVSYAVQVAVIVAVYFLLRFTVDPGTWWYIFWMMVGVLMVIPVNFRLSRVVWLNFFVSYRGRQNAS